MTSFNDITWWHHMSEASRSGDVVLMNNGTRWGLSPSSILMRPMNDWLGPWVRATPPHPLLIHKQSYLHLYSQVSIESQWAHKNCTAKKSWACRPHVNFIDLWATLLFCRHSADPSRIPMIIFWDYLGPGSSVSVVDFTSAILTIHFKVLYDMSSTLVCIAFLYWRLKSCCMEGLGYEQAALQQEVLQ